MPKKNTTIFVKLLRIFLFLTVLIGATWVACLVFFYQRSDRASTAHSLANEIAIWMLQARRNEKDFQLRDIRTAEFYQKGTSANLAKHTESVAGMRKAIDQLDALHQAATRQTIGDLREAVDGYNQSFAKLVAAYRERGFADWGAEGDWRTAAHDIESRLSAAGNAALTISLLSVRRHEKDYLLRADDQYVQQLTGELERLRAGAGRLGEPTRSALLADIDKYGAAVQHYLQVQAQIGLTENDGLQGGMREAIHKVEPLVAAVVEETTEAQPEQGGLPESAPLDHRHHGGGFGRGRIRLLAVRPLDLQSDPEDGRPPLQPGGRGPEGGRGRAAARQERRDRRAGGSAVPDLHEAALHRGDHPGQRRAGGRVQ